MAKPVKPEILAEQKAIKEICAFIRKQRDCDWMTLLNDHIGLGVSNEYEKNFDKGLVGQESLAQIKEWLLTHEADLAYGMHPELFPRSLRTQWQGLIEERGRCGQVHTKPFGTGQLHEISHRKPVNARIKLGEEFAIEVDCPIAGSVIALTQYRNEWYPLCLRGEAMFDPIPVPSGVHGFPIQNGSLGQIIPMRQSHYAGQHDHCFIVGPQDLMAYYAERFIPKKALSLPFLNQMAKRLMELDESKLAVLLEHVIFE